MSTPQQSEGYRFPSDLIDEVAREHEEPRLYRGKDARSVTDAAMGIETPESGS